jgi:hypothetical protein
VVLWAWWPATIGPRDERSDERVRAEGA